MGRTVGWFGAAVALWFVLALLARADEVPASLTSRTLLASGLTLTYLLSWGWRTAISAVPRHTLFRAVVVTGSLLVVILGLEVLAAAGIVHWGALFRLARGPENPFMTNFVQYPDGWFQRPPGASWTGRPQSDLESRWGVPASLPEPITFTYDARGFRNLELFDSADVALIGDSYVEGAYVSDDQTVARVLHTTLDRPVVNLGVAGFGPSYELRVLTRHAVPLGPSVVVWFLFEGNDLYDVDLVPPDSVQGARVTPAPPSALRRIVSYFTDPRQLRQRSFTYNLLWALSSLAHPVLPNRIPDYGVLSLPGRPSQLVYFGDYGSVPWTSYEIARWSDIQELLRTGSELARSGGFHLMIVFIPTKFRVYEPVVTFPARSRVRDWVVSPLPRLFSDFCREADLTCLDLTEPLRQAVTEGLVPYALVDTHWGPAGHEIVAALLADELGRRGWLE
jgi:hypothetical protein